MHKYRATKFCAVVPNICGPSVWNLLHVTSLVPIILRFVLDFWKICAPLYDNDLKRLPSHTSDHWCDLRLTVHVPSVVQ